MYVVLYTPETDSADAKQAGNDLLCCYAEHLSLGGYKSDYNSSNSNSTAKSTGDEPMIALYAAHIFPAGNTYQEIYAKLNNQTAKTFLGSTSFSEASLIVTHHSRERLQHR